MMARASNSLGAVTDAAWHPDPSGTASWRWWDGYKWTEKTAPAGPAPGLQPLMSAIGFELELDRPIRELRAGPATYARFEESGRTAVAHAHEGSWGFQGQGFLSSTKQIYVLPQNALIAQFDWRGLGGLPGSEGVLQFTDGRHFPLVRTESIGKQDPGLLDKLGAMMSASWSFVDAQRPDRALITADYERGRVVRLRTDVAAREVVGLPLLMLAAVHLVWAALENQEAGERNRRRRRRFD